MVLVITFITLTICVFMIVTILTIVGDKKTGLFNKRAKTPIKTALAYTISLSIFGFIVASIVLGYVTYVMDTTIIGEMSSAVLLMFLIAVMGVSLGVFATSITRTKKQGMVRSEKNLQQILRCNTWNI